jgi:hypothetical protein
MMALLPIILFVTTDIYEKVKIRRLKCFRTMRKQTWSWFMANVIKMLLPLRGYADNKHFPKNSSFFHLTKRMTFRYVKIYKLYSYSSIFPLLGWRHDFLPRFLYTETTETKKKPCVYLLLVTLWLFYAPVNLTIFNCSLITLITNVTFRINCQQIWNLYSAAQLTAHPLCQIKFYGQRKSIKGDLIISLL